MQDLVLPAFQRGYIWSKEQVKELMGSLVKGYPVGNLLFWRTDNPPTLKNLQRGVEESGVVDVIIDGEQILTSLFILVTGEIPPYYTEQDIGADPRDLYYNLETGNFRYYQESMKGNPLWWQVVDCFSQRAEVAKSLEIAKQQAKHTDEVSLLAEQYHDNLYRLRYVLEADLPVLVIHATFDEVIDIFQRFMPEPDREFMAADLTGLGESETLEFKRTLQWDPWRGEVNQELHFQTLKTIVAFLNTRGGTLIIGVEDNGSVCGLEQDLKTTGNSQDGFQKTLMNLVSDRIGARFAPFIKTRFETIEGKVVCIVDASRAQEPAYMRGPRVKEFYIRLGNTSRKLDIEDAVNYIQASWKRGQGNDGR